MGLVNHKKVGARDLFEILKASKTDKDFKQVLYTMNMFYNFGVKLKHRELASRLLAAAMVCKEESEAVQVVRLYSTWLEHPPDSSLAYATMGHFIDAGEPLKAREIAAVVREDWRQPIQPALYVLASEATQLLPKDQKPLEETAAVHADAFNMGVRLPAPVHTKLMVSALYAFEEAAGAKAADGAEEDGEIKDVPLHELKLALAASGNLERDGHLRGGANAATLCALSWLHWHIAALPTEPRASLGEVETEGTAMFAGSWARMLEAAIENFGCHWGFAGQLPRGFFRALEASEDAEAVRLVAVSRARFGRFYPQE